MSLLLFYLQYLQIILQSYYSASSDRLVPYLSVTRLLGPKALYQVCVLQGPPIPNKWYQRLRLEEVISIDWFFVYDRFICGL